MLRQGTVQITGTDYIPEIPNEENVKQQINTILQIENETERAIEYMLYGMRSQLFWDGNKRTSTICANKIMIENGCGIIKVPDNKLKDFTILLSEFYSTNKKKQSNSLFLKIVLMGLSFQKIANNRKKV